MEFSNKLARALLFITIFVFPTVCSAQEVTFPKDTLKIESASGVHSFDIELATTAQQFMRGLMYRKSLAADKGMLFIFPESQVAQFWMKNTFIPLDMVFIDKKGTITKIVKQAEPKSLTVISSDIPVKAVLEILGGTAGALKLTTGDKVRHESFSK